MAVAAGADALGLVGPMPSGPGTIAVAEAAAIAASIPPPVAAVFLSAATELPVLEAQLARVRPAAVQLVAPCTPSLRAALKRTFPGLRIIQVLHVTGPESLDEAEKACRNSDALLLDSGRPGEDPPRLGGTGEPHDWRIARRIRDRVSLPVFLAGGLRPENVAAAIAAVRPFAVDVCSGVRRDGGLDRHRLCAFLAAAGDAPPA